MSILSGFPKGLLDLVGSQNFGINPKDLGETVQPVIDLTELYLVGKIDAPQGSLAVAVNGVNIMTVGGVGDPLLVPNGEVWRVFAFAVSCFVGAASSFTYGPAVQMQGGRFQLSRSQDNATALSSNWNAMDSAPIWLPAGARLMVEGQNLVGTASLSAQALISRLRA